MQTTDPSAKSHHIKPGKIIRIPKWRDGFPHGIFLILDGKYFELDSDTLKNLTVFERERKTLSRSFSEAEIKRMKPYMVYRTIWSYSSHMPPRLIKENDKTIFDINKF